MKRTRIALPLTAVLAAAVIVGGSGRAEAGLVYSFDAITNNNPTNTAVGEAQITVQVNDLGGNHVEFVFKNAGPIASSITQVYFDDGSLLGISSITNGSGVAFSQGASPPNLPGGNTIDFNTSAGFLASANSPVASNGVNPGETLKIAFNLKASQTYANTIAAINLSLANPGVDMVGGLRIGIHVQAIGTGGSESFVNGPSLSAVPEPSTVVLAASGFATFAVSAFRCRRRE